MSTCHGLRSPEGKRAANIGPSGGGGELCLRRRGDGPDEDVRAHRDARCDTETSGEQESLIESAIALPSPMERHRDDKMRSAARKLMGNLSEQIPQGGRERTTPAELQGMHGLTRDVLISDSRPRIVEQR